MKSKHAAALPRKGRPTAEVLRELGCSNEEIARLREQGVV